MDFNLKREEEASGFEANWNLTAITRRRCRALESAETILRRKDSISPTLRARMFELAIVCSADQYTVPSSGSGSEIEKKTGTQAREMVESLTEDLCRHYASKEEEENKGYLPPNRQFPC